MITTTKEILDLANSEYSNFVSKYETDFLAQFLDELYKDKIMGNFLSLVLEGVRSIKPNREQSCMMGAIAMYFMMDAVLQTRLREQFERLTKVGVN